MDVSSILQPLYLDTVLVSPILVLTKVGSTLRLRYCNLHFQDRLPGLIRIQISNASFTVRSEGSDLNFIKSWKPVVKYPTQDIAKINLLGYQEL